MSDTCQTQELAEASIKLLGQDLRLWGLLLLSVASLIWNEVNRRQTKRTANKIRQENIRLEEFRGTVKDPLREALDTWQSIAIKVESIALSQKSFPDLERDLADAHTICLAAFADLETKLSDADDSEFSADRDWTEGFPEFQDNVYQSFDTAFNDKRPYDERRRALGQIKTRVLEFRKKTLAKIDQEITKISTSN